MLDWAQEGPELTVPSAGAPLIRQSHAKDVLPVRGSQRRVLEQQEEDSRCQQNQEAHQEGWLHPGGGAWIFYFWLEMLKRRMVCKLRSIMGNGTHPLQCWSYTGSPLVMQHHPFSD